MGLRVLVGQRPDAFARHQLVGDQLVDGDAALLNLPQQDLHAAVGELAGVLPHGGEAGDHIAGQLDAVEAHNGDVLRHPKSPLMEGAHGADGLHIGHGEHRRQVGGFVQQAAHGAIATGDVKPGDLILPVLIEGNSAFPEGLLAAMEAGIRGMRYVHLAAQDADVPVPQGDKGLDHLHGGGLIIGADAGEVVKVQPLRAVGDQNTGDGDGRKAVFEKGGIAAQKEEAEGAALAVDLDGLLHLVLILVDVVDEAGVAAVLDERLHPLDNAGEQHVLGALNDDGDAGAGLLLEMLCVAVELKLMLLYHRHNGGPSFVGYAGAVIEDAGNGAHGVPGQARNVFDGQWGAPPLISPLPHRRQRP